MTLVGLEATKRGSSSDSLRRHNLSAVLTLVHHDQSISRSRLTAITGLNRSTIAALVAELVERGHVIESEPNPNKHVGRPSPMVQPDPRTIAIAVNPEVDAITVGVVGLGGTVVKRVRHALGHPPTVVEAVKISEDIIRRMRAELDRAHRVVGIGLALPGLVRARDGLVRLAPHLGWSDEPVADLLEAATGYSVVAANDASLGAKAEQVFGAGRGVSDMIYLNGGASGIGGGIIAGGRPLGGVAGYAGEFGHTLVTSRRTRDATGSAGSLELEVNRAALLRAVGLSSADPDELENALLSADSAEVLAEVQRQLGFLGLALRNAIDILNPELIVLGGFLGSLLAVDPGFLESAVAGQALAASYASVRIVRAQLGSDILMIGAAELAFARLLADPATALDARR
jgi:predicted NBD/HSP70 family sugar kinase